MWVFCIFFFDPSSNLRTPPQMPQEDLGMVEKQSGSKGRKLLEKAGIRGEVAGGNFPAPQQKATKLTSFPKTTKISQLSNCTKREAISTSQLFCLDYITGWLDKKPIDLVHLWTFGSHQFFRKIQCQSVHWKYPRPRSRKLMDLCTWDVWKNSPAFDLFGSKKLPTPQPKCKQKPGFFFSSSTVNVYFIFTSPCFFFF